MKIGDKVTRMLGGIGGVKMNLKITEITENQIICGSWVFCALTGAEIDEDLDWGPPPKHTGSYLLEIAAPEQTDGPDPQPAHVEVFALPNGQNISSVIMDEAEFMEIIDQLGEILAVVVGEQMVREQQEHLRKLKLVPLMAKGDKTQFVFDRYGIETELVSLIVRGQGRKLVKQINEMAKSIQRFNPENN